MTVGPAVVVVVVVGAAVVVVVVVVVVAIVVVVVRPPVIVALVDASRGVVDDTGLTRVVAVVLLPVVSMMTRGRVVVSSGHAHSCGWSAGASKQKSSCFVTESEQELRIPVLRWNSPSTSMFPAASAREPSASAAHPSYVTWSKANGRKRGNKTVTSVLATPNC